MTLGCLETTQTSRKSRYARPLKLWTVWENSETVWETEEMDGWMDVKLEGNRIDAVRLLMFWNPTHTELLSDRKGTSLEVRSDSAAELPRSAATEWVSIGWLKIRMVKFRLGSSSLFSVWRSGAASYLIRLWKLASAAGFQQSSWQRRFKKYLASLPALRRERELPDSL